MDEIIKFDGKKFKKEKATIKGKCHDCYFRYKDRCPNADDAFICLGYILVEYEDPDSDQKRSDAVIQELEREVDVLIFKNKDLKQKNQRISAWNKRLRPACTKLREDLDNTIERNKELESWVEFQKRVIGENHYLYNESESSKTDLRIAKKEIETLKAELKCSEFDCKVLRDAVEFEMKTIEKLKDSITRSHRGNNRYENKLKEEVELLYKDRKELYKWLDLARSEAIDKSLKCSELQEKIKDLKRYNNNISTVNIRRRKEIKDLREQVKYLILKSTTEKRYYVG